MKHEDAMYGVFHGGDPRNFTPDGECSTEEERANHKAVCEAITSAELEGKPLNLSDPDCAFIGGDGYAAIITRCQFGLGVNSYEWDCEGEADCPECHPGSDVSGRLP